MFWEVSCYQRLIVHYLGFGLWVLDVSATLGLELGLALRQELRFGHHLSKEIVLLAFKLQ